MKNDFVFIGFKVEPLLKADVEFVANEFFDGNTSKFLRCVLVSAIELYRGLAARKQAMAEGQNAAGEAE